MTDKSWLLNPSAIRAAKACIEVTQQELGVKLKLSHPQFLEMLGEYVDLTESDSLKQAYAELAVFAGIQVSMEPAATKVVEMPITHTAAPQTSTPAPTASTDEMVQYKGKSYRRFENGMEFKGLYRGQPRYA